MNQKHPTNQTPFHRRFKIIKSLKLSSTHKLMLHTLNGYANSDGYCYPRVISLAEDCSISERQARRILSALNNFTLIEKTKLHTGKKQNRNGYLLNIDHIEIKTITTGHGCPVLKPTTGHGCPQPTGHGCPVPLKIPYKSTITEEQETIEEHHDGKYADVITPEDQ